MSSVLSPEQRQDSGAFTNIPPYYPDTPVVREDWKRNYENITAMDYWAGELIQELKDRGEYENTIIIFWSRLIDSTDFGPTVLNLAGLPIPKYIQGRAFLGTNLSPSRKYVYGARDRMDERYDERHLSLLENFL